jgi:hypothetical protein
MISALSNQRPAGSNSALGPSRNLPAGMRTLPFRALVICLALLGLHGCANGTHDHAVSPAYRPASEASEQFLQTLAAATVAVYPSVIRTADGNSYSTKSQQQIVNLLNQKRITRAQSAVGNISLPPPKREAQWAMFMQGLHAAADSLAGVGRDADYSLLMDFVFAPGNQAIFGIHCYILDRQVNNVFSFLMNSHHRPFVEADLVAGDTSAAARAQLVQKATQVGVTALIQQASKPPPQDTRSRQGYSVDSQLLTKPDEKVTKIFVVTRVDEPLVHVFMRSFRHSLVSAFASNTVEVSFNYLRRDSTDYAKFDSEIESFSADSLMYIDLDTLYRKRKDGRQAVVGTRFDVKLIDRTSEAVMWQANGRVDYIAEAFSNRSNYTAHEGIRKEFAWHTTAAIVRTFTLDVNGHKSAPIYTVTEDREVNRQRTD